ncbi:cyclin-dependent kinase 4 inhibitor B [Electrophorus electricus]|uniref:Uncharacterized protein n=1 Tax=Electrophorus electricus TaxID=8005 RepID=A0A4W4FSN7_ELEEL|nr:cyclin-dependent kinase 4 inhibitor B [Electrophorus electricus]
MHDKDKLATAAANGNVELVESLLLNGADVNGVNRFGRTPIQVMMMGSTPVARVLLAHGADPNVVDAHAGATPLHDAARTGFLDTVKILIQFGANPDVGDNNNYRPVDLAQQNGHQEKTSKVSRVALFRSFAHYPVIPAFIPSYLK